MLSKDAFSCYLVFSSMRSTPREHWIWLLVALVCTWLQSLYVNGNKMFIFFIQCLSFKCLQKSINYVSYSYRIFIVYIIICGDQSYRKPLHVCFLFLHKLRWIFAETILWLKGNPLKQKYASLFKDLYIQLLFLNI